MYKEFTRILHFAPDIPFRIYFTIHVLYFPYGYIFYNGVRVTEIMGSDQVKKNRIGIGQDPTGIFLRTNAWDPENIPETWFRLKIWRIARVRVWNNWAPLVRKPKNSISTIILLKIVIYHNVYLLLLISCIYIFITTEYFISTGYFY